MVKQQVVETKDEEEPVEEQKKGRGRKRKAKSKPQYNDVSLYFKYHPLLHKYASMYLLAIFCAKVLFVI